MPCLTSLSRREAVLSWYHNAHLLLFQFLTLHHQRMLGTQAHVMADAIHTVARDLQEPTR